MNRITLKNVKHSEFASQETNCYEASIYFDGKKIGAVGNDGHGGCDNQYPENRAAWADMEAYIKSLPSKMVDIGLKDGELYEAVPDVESICNELVTSFLVRRDYKRLIKNKVVFALDGELRATGKCKNAGALPSWCEQIAVKYPTAKILNTMPEADALALYKSIG